MRIPVISSDFNGSVRVGTGLQIKELVNIRQKKGSGQHRTGLRIKVIGIQMKGNGLHMKETS